MLLRNLHQHEKQLIEEEIQNNLHLSGDHAIDKHYMQYGALKNGKSIHLVKDSKFIAEENFPKTCQLLKSLSENLISQVFGKTYIYKLQPGASITKHADLNELYFYKILRYHIYLDIPDGVSIMHIGEPIVPNSLILFNHQELHEYINKSEKDIFFLVFDLYK